MGFTSVYLPKQSFAYSDNSPNNPKYCIELPQIGKYSFILRCIDSLSGNIPDFFPDDPPNFPTFSSLSGIFLLLVFCVIIRDMSNVATTDRVQNSLSLNFLN